MPYNLILNSSNVINNNNSIFKYTFSNGSFNIYENSEICISNIVIPYSWFNINQNYYNNATIAYKWNNIIYTCIFPNGFYLISDLNSYLQLYMISQNQYLTNISSGTNIYYISIIQNTTYYSNQIILYPIPTSLPSGYTAPANFVYSTTTQTPQLIIYYGIGLILGFLPSTYPLISQSSIYTMLSNITPNATPVNSIIVRCDIINNGCSSPSDILDSFNINANFGSNVTYNNPYPKWVTISEGTFNSISIFFEDQNFNTLQCNDSNVLISLLIRQGPKPKKLLKEIQFKDDN